MSRAIMDLRVRLRLAWGWVRERLCSGHLPHTRIEGMPDAVEVTECLRCGALLYARIPLVRVYGVPGTMGCLVLDYEPPDWLLDLSKEKERLVWLYSLLGGWDEAMAYYHELQGWAPYVPTREDGVSAPPT